MSKYIVLDIEENEYYECDGLEQVGTKVSDLTEKIYEDYGGKVAYKEHIKVYELVETVSRVEDVEATKETGEEIGKWQHKK